MSKETTEEKISATFTVAKIEEIEKRLRELEPPAKSDQTIGKREALSHLVDALLVMRENGYSVEKIAELLKAEDPQLDFKVSTLKSCLVRAKRQKKAEGSAARKGGKSRAAPGAKSNTSNTNSVEVARSLQPASDSDSDAGYSDERLSFAGKSHSNKGIQDILGGFTVHPDIKDL